VHDYIRNRAFALWTILNYTQIRTDSPNMKTVRIDE